MNSGCVIQCKSTGGSKWGQEVNSGCVIQCKSTGDLNGGRRSGTPPPPVKPQVIIGFLKNSGTDTPREAV